MLRGTGNVEEAAAGEIPGNDLVVPNEGKANIETYSEVSQSLKAEHMQFDAMVSDKPTVTVEAVAEKVCMESMLKDSSEAFQVKSVHNQDKNVTVPVSVSYWPSTVEVSDPQNEKYNNARNETSSHMDIISVYNQTGHEFERNGEVVTGDFQLDHVDAANIPDDSKLTDDMITVAEDEVRHETNGNSLSANIKYDSASSHAFTVVPDTNQRNVVDVQGIADTSFAVEVQDEVDGSVPLCDGEIDEPGFEDNESSGEHIQSYVGISVKSQHVFSCVNDSLEAANTRNKDARAGIGLSLECSRGIYHEINDSVTSEPQDSSEAAEPIRSYVPDRLEAQKHPTGSEIVDAMFQDVSDDDRSDDANDAENTELDGMMDVSLNEELGDPEGINMYGQENLDEDLLDDAWESHSQDEPVYDAEIPQDEEDNAGCSSYRSGSQMKGYRASYDLAPEISDEISVSDLVWGKVKSHPWWPGQIFHPSDCSEKAKKYYRKDCYLVGYFGDRSFAWNDVSQLRPFRRQFFEVENQSSSESFQNAVNCALEEVHRRIEVGLACSCLPQDMYEKVRFQTVQNAGIRKEARRREGGDSSTSLEFQPDNLVRFVRRLAQFPTCGANRLELATAKAHVSSFFRLKGYYPLPEFQVHGGLLEDDVDSSVLCESTIEKADPVTSVGVSGAGRTKEALKRKHNLKDIVYRRRKEKSFSEIMGDSMFYYDEDYESDEKLNDMTASPTPRKKKKAKFLGDDFIVQNNTKTISKVSKTVNPSPRQSFKIGDCIRRVASQLTGTPSSSAASPKASIHKVIGEDDKPHFGNNLNDSFQIVEETKTEEMAVPAEESSPDQLLLQLQLSACNPSEVYSFSEPMISFFSEFRDSVASSRHSSKEPCSSSKKGVVGRKRKSALVAGGLSEAFEFEEKGDSYWTDMVVQHDSAEKPERRGRKRKVQQHQDVTDQEEKPVKIKRKYTKRQQTQGGNNDEVRSAENLCEATKIKTEQLETELILNFSDIAYLPSEMNLNKMLKRFGRLIESETRVDRESSHARVIFKRGSDAEVAYSSVAAFGIFGPNSAVSYQLNYTPSFQSETQPPPSLTNQSEGAT